MVECDACGRALTGGDGHRCADGTRSLVHDVDRIREAVDPDGAPDDQWRYAPLLPVEASEAVTLGEGGTALVAAPALSDDLGVDLSLKLEGANPSGSTKDRGSSVLVTHARQRGAETVACASTGNAAASLAAYAARASLACRLFVPDGLPDAKAVQPQIYGADVDAVADTYDGAAARCRTMAATEEWVDRSAGASPFTAAGARTLGYELADQMSTVPDWVVVPMGNGGTLADAWAGFETFAELGFVAGTPRFLGVQAERAPAIHETVHGESDGAAGDSCADSIDVGSPHRREDAAAAIEDSGGTTVTVSERAIRDATVRLGRAEGVFVEPACGAALAGIDAARDAGIVDRGDAVVAAMTGSGLKDTATARQALEQD